MSESRSDEVPESPGGERVNVPVPANWTQLTEPERERWVAQVYEYLTRSPWRVEVGD